MSFLGDEFGNGILSRRNGICKVLEVCENMLCWGMVIILL